jgi:hypothetical protein
MRHRRRRCSRAPEISSRAAAATPTSPSCATQGVAVTCTSGRRCHARAPGIRHRGRCHLAVVRTSWGRRRVRALGIRCRNRSNLAAVRASGAIATRWPQGSAAASMSPGSAVARLLPESATARASWWCGRNCRRR